LRILILALIGNDGRLTAEFLSKAGLEAEICRDVSDLCNKIEAGSAAMILAEETLDSKSIPALIETLERQPSWSNIPITIVTSGGETTQSRLRRLGAFGHARNVTILERPFRPSTLISTVEVALNARRRQYQVRDLLLNLQASEDHLKSILESISDGFAALDKSWSFTYVNNSFLS
jgi:DNA-binding response OmpR family regulator